MPKKNEAPADGDLFETRTLKSFVEFFDKSGLSELKLRLADKSLHLSKAPRALPAAPATPAPAAHAAAGAPAAAALPPAPLPPAGPGEGEKLLEITSPIVGTFYRSASPDAKAFVEVGEEIITGKVVCIIEAMKIMNEIESEVSGFLHEICVENEQPVEYGQVLFRVKPKA